MDTSLSGLAALHRVDCSANQSWAALPANPTHWFGSPKSRRTNLVCPVSATL